MQYLSLLISVVIYAAYLSGLVLAFSGSFALLARRIKLRRRLTGSMRPKAPRFDPALKKLAPVCAVLFASALAVALGSFGTAGALALALIAASLPMLGYYARKGMIKRRSGKEGVALVTELYRQYRVKDCNIYEALAAAVSSNADFPAGKKHLSLLLARLRDAGDKTQVIRACRSFASSVGTLWGRMLAGCIEAAVIRGADISDALSDIAEQLAETRKLAEERRRLNSEAVRMTVFLVPLLYLGTMFLAAFFLGVEPADLLRNQFASPQGLLLLLLSVFLFLADLILLQRIEDAGSEF